MPESDGSYVVWRAYGAGFWSIMASTLAQLRIAQDRGLTPVIDYQNYKTVYNEDFPINGQMNMWEYYFEQPAGRSLKEVEDEAFVCDGRIPRGFPGDLTHSFYREQWRTHVRIKPEIQERIGASARKLDISATTLGVHLRGQEARRAKGHMFPGTVAQFNSAISYALHSGNFNKILVVSEGQQYIDAIRRNWESDIEVQHSPTFRLKYKNAYRLKTAPRPFHRFELGFEALQDAHLLARCGGLVRGHSGISDAASMIRENEEFNPQIKIAQGRNSLRQYIAPWLWYAKALLPGSAGGFQRWTPT